MVPKLAKERYCGCIHAYVHIFITACTQCMHSTHTTYTCTCAKRKTIIDNNSAISHHRMVPKVTNERHFHVIYIYGDFWGMGMGGPSSWQDSGQ